VVKTWSLIGVLFFQTLLPFEEPVYLVCRIFVAWAGISFTCFWLMSVFCMVFCLSRLENWSRWKLT